jgi:hypothetical protein
VCWDASPWAWRGSGLVFQVGSILSWASVVTRFMGPGVDETPPPVRRKGAFYDLLPAAAPRAPEARVEPTAFPRKATTLSAGFRMCSICPARGLNASRFSRRAQGRRSAYGPDFSLARHYSVRSALGVIVADRPGTVSFCTRNGLRSPRVTAM